MNRGYSGKCRTDSSTNSAKSTSEKTTSSKRTFDIKFVEEFIEIHIIRDHKIVSMSQLQDVYDDKTQKDINVRRNIKKMLVKIFGNKLIFVTVIPNKPDVVISSEAIKSTMNMLDRKSNLKKPVTCVRISRNTVDHYQPLSWPRTVEELSTESTMSPTSVTLLLTNLLKSKDDVQTLKSQ